MRQSLAVVVMIAFVPGCAGCEEDPNFDPCTVPASEDNLTDAERAERCYRTDPVEVGDEYHDALRRANARPPEPTFEERYREFLANQDLAERCEDALGSDACRDAKEAIVLLHDLDAIASAFPDRAADLARDLVRLQKTRAAEITREFGRVNFDLLVDYGAQEDRYETCFSSGRRRCGKDPTAHLRCSIDVRDLEEYVDVLTALGPDAPSMKLRDARVAFARLLENPSPLHCEGEVHLELERAYELYKALDDRTAMRRVAQKRAEEMLSDEVCTDLEGWWDDDEVPAVHRDEPPSCDLEALDRAEEWLVKAGAKPDHKWRAEVAALADWAIKPEHVAENPKLPCAAITLAGRAGDAERVRKYLLAYGSQCAGDGGRP